MQSGMGDQQTAPVLSTPATHIFEQQPFPTTGSAGSRLSDERLYLTYEIERTVAEIRRGRYRRVALQFPDDMLVDAPRVYRMLQNNLHSYSGGKSKTSVVPQPSGSPAQEQPSAVINGNDVAVKLSILGDTSYSPCCVDEIAAEHASADAVVHYGRACLSPTARIPTIYVFTTRTLDDERDLIRSLETLYKDRDTKIILMADVMYQGYLKPLAHSMEDAGFTNVFATEVLHDPASLIPNRTLPADAQRHSEQLRQWHIFHVSDPPEALLLILSSRVASIRIYSLSESNPLKGSEIIEASSSRALSRRYALLTSVSSVPIIGVLINTLSVKNYQDVVERVKSEISAAGKKSYMFVVGKLNAAKVANFSEIGAWVVIGCWESSLIDSKDFWKPLITPFELSLALQRDQDRVWTGEWRSEFTNLLATKPKSIDLDEESQESTADPPLSGLHNEDDILEGEPESAPPDFDLRTGGYVSQSRPMIALANQGGLTPAHRHQGNDLIRRINGDVAAIGGTPSPGAEFLQSKRTWKGLGSDFEIAYDESGATLEEGRSGIARGYGLGEGGSRS